MKPLRILHISNWFAEPTAPHRVPFISEHFEALSPYVTQQLWHLEVQGTARGWHWHMASRGLDKHALLLFAPVRSWQFRELFTLLLLIILRIRLVGGQWDLVILHIAYPLLRFPRFVRLLFGSRLLLIEHWSAYQTNFQLPPSSPALRRLQGMFSTGIPLVAVSEALATEIRRFAGRSDLAVDVVPNAVDTSLFRYELKVQSAPQASFLMVANWAPIKRPMFVFSAIRALLPDWPALRLRVIGGGSQLPAMQDYISQFGLHESVQLLGFQPKTRIASELQCSTALLHPSAYETFSVVCAESLCCGVPVLASNVGALPELITPYNGRLVENTEEAWMGALQDLLIDPPVWDYSEIAEHAAACFSRKAVGLQLLNVATKVAHSM